MAINLDNLTRPKATTTDTVTAALTVASAVEVDSTEESHFIPIRLGATDPSSFTVSSVATTNGSATITTTSNGFANVKVGDALSGTGIAVGATVSAKASNTSLTMSANATATGSITLTVDPPSGTPTVLALKVVYSESGNILSFKPYLYVYDGSLAPGVNGSDANYTTVFELQSKDGKPMNVDLDAFLTNYRVFRA